jgi:hypothetical protein
MFVKLRAMKSFPAFGLVVSIFSGGDAGTEGEGGATSCAEGDAGATSCAEGGGGATSCAEGGGGGATSCADTALVMTSPARSRAILFFTLGLRYKNYNSSSLFGERTMIAMNTEDYGTAEILRKKPLSLFLFKRQNSFPDP